MPSLQAERAGTAHLAATLSKQLLKAGSLANPQDSSLS